jgi:hypothetical protein
MRLFSAYDDFIERTLGELSGALAKVRFVSSLRSSHQGYEHWGLERTYGQESAQAAMSKAHTEAFIGELSTPLSQLWEELTSTAKVEEVEAGKWADSELNLMDGVPSELGGGAIEHHRYVLSSLALLARTRGPAIRQAA